MAVNLMGRTDPLAALKGKLKSDTGGEEVNLTDRGSRWRSTLRFVINERHCSGIQNIFPNFSLASSLKTANTTINDDLV